MEISQATLLQYVKRAKDGDIIAFALIKFYTEPEIKGFVEKKVENRGDSDVITEEIYDRVKESIQNFDESQGEFLSWLYGIARNTILDYFGPKGHPKTDTISEKEEEKILSESSLSPATIYEQIRKQGSLKKEIWEMLLQLPPRRRFALIYKFWKNYDNETIAEKMKCSTKAVRQLLYNALKKMREIVSKNEKIGSLLKGE